jgi:uncharacterized lipoprotein YddW (UPF0748 family)
MTRPLFAAALLTLATACTSATTAPGAPPSPRETAPPPLVREMRGVWIATVANIDWPSRATLTAEQQRAELSDLFDRAAAVGLNAVVLQVRSAADAIYPSSIEPWSAVLGGTPGAGPGYDPLAYAVAQAHARGLELHAWINPFRAGNTADSASLPPTHIFRTRRDLVRIYGGQLWLDPGEPDVHEHVLRVVRDIVQRYDVDGVHADDYFYPYPVKDSAGAPRDFPDSASYAKSGSPLARDDWRRANVDRFVERLYREVHASRPTLKVGISPFGIWRPGNPPGVAGLDAYAAIYADSRKWLQEGWVGYLAPQLYWAIGAPQQSFPALLDWWASQNVRNRHLWPGLATYRVGDGSAGAFGATEIAEQVALARARAAVTGHLLYNATTTLRKNGSGITASLVPLYATRALVPASPWLGATPPAAASISVTGRTVTIIPAAGEPVRWWFVRWRGGGQWHETQLFGDQRSLVATADVERVLVNAIDGAGNASGEARWAPP